MTKYSSNYSNEALPMSLRRHGNTTARPLNHVLSERKPASYYTRLVMQEKLEIQKIEEMPQDMQPFNPKFIANDKKVLRFHAYFLEAVHESELENYRVRQCDIFYYLEDDTIQVTEPKVENSGILQGNFIKRHKFPKPEADMNGNLRYFTWEDLNIGEQVTFYGRKLYIISMDAFSRQYLTSQGIQVPIDEQVPRDAYTEIRKAQMSRETGQDPNAYYGKKQYPMKAFMEASLGKFARPPDQLRRVLEHGRKVLRFYAIWDDTEKLYGMKHQYTIHFFLADNTIEILETLGRNSGCDPFPRLLNRAKLMKDPSKQGIATVGDSTHEETSSSGSRSYYTWEDFAIGKFLPIYQRKILILDADASTREWYLSQNQKLDDAIHIQDPAPKSFPFLPPPHSGIGSEDDSLQSCYHLLPKAPLKSIESLNTTEILRFRARMDTKAPEDIDRHFVLSVIVSDQSVQILEPAQRNSGILGGKFLERIRVKKGMTPDGHVAYLNLDDFYVGAALSISGRIFILYDIDEYSANYMETHALKFPRANIHVVLKKLKPMAGQCIDLLLNLDDKEHILSKEQLTEMMQSIMDKSTFTMQEAITIIRAFGEKKTMTIGKDILEHVLSN